MPISAKWKHKSSIHIGFIVFNGGVTTFFAKSVLKTHYMIFTPRKKIYDDVSIIIDNTKISRVYVTKFLGVQIGSQSSWKMHIDYICIKNI